MLNQVQHDDSYEANFKLTMPFGASARRFHRTIACEPHR